MSEDSSLLGIFSVKRHAKCVKMATSPSCIYKAQELYLSRKQILLFCLPTILFISITLKQYSLFHLQQYFSEFYNQDVFSLNFVLKTNCKVRKTCYIYSTVQHKLPNVKPKFRNQRFQISRSEYFLVSLQACTY